MKIRPPRSFLAAVTTLTLAPVFAVASPLPPASAAPLPAPYAASAHGDLVGLSATLLGLPSLADVKVGHSRSDVDSDRLTDDVVSEAANLDASLIFGGADIPVGEQRATAGPKDDPARAQLLGSALDALDPIIDVGIIDVDTYADYAGDNACPPAVGGERVLSDSRTQLAGATLAPLPGLGSIATVEASTVHTTIKLVDNGDQTSDVVATTKTVVGDIRLLGDTVRVDVGNTAASPVTVRARSNGTTGSIALVNPPTITATVGSTVTPIPLNGNPITISTGNPLVTVTLNAFNASAVVDNDGDAVASADLQYLLRARVNVAQLFPLPALANVDLNLAPLSVRAEAPAGGVECVVPDAAAPAPPVIDSPADGDTVTDPTPRISGSGAEPGSTVTVYDEDDNVLCTDDTVGIDGLWSCSPTTNLPLGDQTVTATSTDEAGNESDPSDPVTFTIEGSSDTTAPDAPVIVAPAQGSNTDGTTPTVSGTAEADSTVTVTEDGTEICTAETNALGNWTCTPTTALPEGEHTFDAVAEDAAGNTSDAESVTFTINDTTAPSAPVIATPANGDETDDTTPTVTGTAEPGSTVTVTEDGTTVCTAVANSSGAWSCTPTTPLAEGGHTFDAVAKDEAGNTSPSDTVTFTVTEITTPGDTTAPDAPVITAPANGSTTTSTRPTIGGTAEPGSSVTVSEGGSTICTTQTNGSGVWSCTPTTAFTVAGHNITATATDAAGNTSPAASSAFTVVADTTTDGGPLTDPDTDGDGLSDSSEVNTTKTDPTKADTDGDGLSDSTEVNATKSDPLNSDTDGDKLKDGQEVNGMVIKERFEVCGRKTKKKITVRTNPLVRDTDKDGLTDGVEVKGFKIKQRVTITRSGRTITIGRTRTNPTKADTDKDGLKDKVEKTGKANKKFARHKSDPTKCDTDGGGVSDGKEVKAGSDPSQIKSGPNDVKRRSGRSSIG